MRVVQLRRGRVLKLLVLAAVSVLCLVLVYRQYRGPDWSNDLLVLSQMNKAGLIREESGAKQSHGSHPEDKPVFLGQGNKGNFEPDSYGGGSQSGDNGKPHQPRVIIVDKSMAATCLRMEHSFHRNSYMPLLK